MGRSHQAKETQVDLNKDVFFKKFGRMPSLQTNVWNEIQRGPNFHLQTLNTNDIFARGESSVQFNSSIIHNIMFNSTLQTQSTTHICISKIILIVGYNNKMTHFIEYQAQKDYLLKALIITMSWYLMSWVIMLIMTIIWSIIYANSCSKL